MRINAIDNRILLHRTTFKAYTDPGLFVQQYQIQNSARQAERFIKEVDTANGQDATVSSGFSAFARKIARAGEILGWGNMNKVSK